MLFPASGPRADEVCAIARLLAAMEMSSRAIALAPGEAAATSAVRELEARLARVGPHFVRMSRPDAGRAELAEAMARFIENRRRLVGRYRTRGLAAARDHALDAEFVAAREAVHELLRRGPGCLPPEARPAQAAAGGGPRTVAGSPTRLGPVNPAGRTGAAARHAAPPAARIWLGVAVIVVLCLLLIAVLAAESAELREDPRFGCHMPARLRIRGAERRVVIVEISRGGAKLRIAQRFVVGERGVVLLLGEPTAFKVVWATPSFCGIAFGRKLRVSSEQLAGLSAGERQPKPPVAALAAQ